MSRETPLTFSRDELVAFILVQQAQIGKQTKQIAVLSARLAELEAKLAAPTKTPDNSSLPPSKGPPRPSVAATGRLRGLSALEALRAALADVPVMRSG